jgi:hypothetical protein
MGILTGVIKGAKMMAISLALGMKRMEDKSITQLGIDDNNDMVREYGQNSVTNDLFKGNATTRVKVYAERFYQILEGADKFAARNRMNVSGDIENGKGSIVPNMMTEQEYANQRYNQLNSIIDKSDKYPLETVIEMKRTCTNELEVALQGKNAIYDCNIKLFTGDDELILMENTLQSIHIKTMGDNNKNLRLIDMFFTFDDKETGYMNEVIKNPSSFLQFDSISINKGKYKPKYELFDVIKIHGVSIPNPNKLCYKVVCKKIEL